MVGWLLRNDTMKGELQGQERKCGGGLKQRMSLREGKIERRVVDDIRMGMEMEWN